MKKLLNIVILSLIIVSPVLVFAQSANSTNNPSTSTSTPSSSPSATVSADVTLDSTLEGTANKAITDSKRLAKTEEKIAKYKESGAAFIDARIALLDKLLAQITKLKISSTVLENITTQINTEKTALVTLKATIAADTTIEKIKADIKLIFSDHRIYAIFAPKIHGLVVVERLELTLSKFKTLEPKIEPYLEVSKKAGKDITAATTAFEDYSVQVKALETALDTAKTKFTAMAIGDNALAKTNLTEAKAALATAKTALDKIKADLDIIYNL